jgi:hypothetical protein
LPTDSFSTLEVDLAYVRLKAFWGAIEFEGSDDKMYSAAETKAMGTTATPPGIGVRRCQIVWERTPTGSTEDVATTTHDFLNLTGGNPDDSWIDADFLSIEGRLDTMWNSLASYINNKTKIIQYRWYRIGPGIATPNPPVRLTTKSIAGQATQSLPPQVALSVTEKTPVRRAWGRFYIPGPSASQVGAADGRWNSSSTTAVMTAASTMYQGCVADGFPPVVYSRTRQKAYTVEAVQVDDLLDVIRRRRWDKPITRAVG